MTSESLGELGERIRQLARVPILVVACDYDGTIAPLVDDPMEAKPNRESVAAMRALASVPQTHVTLISGRSLRDLALLSRFPEEIRLIGSHGSEFDLGFALTAGTTNWWTFEPGSPQRSAVLGASIRRRVEEKPTGVTFHLRGMTSETAGAARADIVAGVSIVGLASTLGTATTSLRWRSLKPTRDRRWKRFATKSVRRRSLFIGDDVTDEDGFKTLQGPDLGIKVGPGQTAAAFRVPDTDTVAKILALLCELREEWQRGAGLVPIEDHSMLSDLRTAAILTPDARVTWMCAPRIDSASIFAELLGGPGAGYFLRRTSGRRQTSRATLSGQLHAGRDPIRRLRGHRLLGRFCGPNPTACRPHRPDPSAGRIGSSRQWSSRPGWTSGESPPVMEVRPDGLVVQGTSDLLVLRAPGLEWEIVNDGIHQTAKATVDLSQGISGPRTARRHRDAAARRPAGVRPAGRHRTLLVQLGSQDSIATAAT